MKNPLNVLSLTIMAVFMFGCGGPAPTAPPAPATTSPQAGATIPTLTVFAAASATDIMTEAAKRFEAQTGVKVVGSYDSSSNLAKQIKAGAPAHIFLSADVKWMDDVATAKSIDPASRFNLLGNQLVLIAPKGKTFKAMMDKSFDFTASLPDVKRIAVGDPAHVPIGRYAKQSLEQLGWWAKIEPLLIPTQDVRAALRLVERGEADAGIVYSTDAKASKEVEVVAAFLADSHEPVVYPIALTTNAHPEAAAFLTFLKSPEMKQVFEDAGFTVLASP